MTRHLFEENLPTKFNSDQFDAELKAVNSDLGAVVKYSDLGETPISIVVDAPESVTYAQVENVLKAHKPTKSSKQIQDEKKAKRQQYIKEDKIEELEQRIAALEAK